MAKTIVVDLEAKTDKAVKELEDLRKEVGKLNNSVVDGNEKTEKSLKSVEGASKSVSKGVKKIGTTLKAIGIGVLISALGTIKDLFTQNQKSVDLFNIAFESTSIVINQITTAFGDIYDAVTNNKDNFDALGKVVGGVITLALTPLKGTFYAIKLALQIAQLAWEESFFGDKDPETIKRLNLSILETKENILGVAKDAVNAGRDIVNNFSEAITETANIGKVVVKELSEVNVKAAINQAKANIELQKSAELAASTQGLIFEKFDRQAEKLRQIRDEERNTIEDRRKANDDLLKLINETETSMLAQAQQQLALADANLKKDKNNIEFQKAKIDALRELAGVEAQIEGIRSEQKSNDLALDRESIELQNTKIESESKLNIERKRFNAEQIDDELLRLQKLQEIDSLEKKQESLRLQAIVDNANAGTQAKIDAQIALDEFMETSRQTELERKKEIMAAEMELEQQKVASKQKALDDIISIADSETKVGRALLIAKQVLGLKEMLMEAKKTITFSALAAAKSTVAVSEGTAQTAKIGFPQNIPLLIGYAAQAAGIISSIKSATGKAKSIASSFGGGGGGGGGSAPVSQPPSFNVVGASSNSQLAEAISSQEQEPVKAYVVSNDVTTAQSMDRNIVDGATL